MYTLHASSIALLALMQADPLRAEPLQVCPEQKQGATTESPPQQPQPVTICLKLHPQAPFVHLPADVPARYGGAATWYGTVELDISVRQGADYYIQQARFVDRDNRSYVLVDAAGRQIDDSSPLMKQNYLPSNRVHYLVYEAKGQVKGTKLQLDALRPIVMLDGRAIDERFLGAWEGTMSKRRPKQADADGGDTQDEDDTWYTDLDEPAHFAKVRVVFRELIDYRNVGALAPTLPPFLADARRHKAVGSIENAYRGVRLSSGECVPSLTSFGEQNPMPASVDTYLLTMWRFPAMHTLWTKDFHIVFDYPKGLYPSAISMATDHNFRLKDYVSPATKPRQLLFGVHGNPVNQLLVALKPAQGGGGTCEP
jgi:hypothetical protein